MHYATVALTAFAAMLSGAAAAPAVSEPNYDSPLPGYKLVPAQWETQAFVDGPFIQLEGTIQEVRAELIKINPNYDADFNITVDANPSPPADLEARTDFNGMYYFCDGRWSTTDGSTTWGNINYLRNIGGKPRLGAGPSTCSRVSCSYGAGITWCNDANSEKELYSFGSIADGAEYIFWRCGGASNVPVWQRRPAGQVFHNTNWNVFITGEWC
ncbi:hypothetical protein CPLU01_12029 [Colletotrichum plurivorum]|uniref:Secreted protein n=1 Tax=Colletotrichum plurivorum TaxID=2175906 RepID=A0A8H6K0D2_9PEZI|nr:hypothetical protein CPLU01_12029 [Colletotrichum plurivorum]